MKTLKIEKDVLDMVIAEMSKSELFSPLSKKSLLQLANIVVLNQSDPDERIVKMNDPSDGCFMIIKGEAVILQHVQPDDEIVEIARRKPYDTIGEIGFLLNQPRGATVQAVKETLMLKFDNTIFDQGSWNSNSGDSFHDPLHRAIGFAYGSEEVVRKAQRLGACHRSYRRW